MSTTGWIDDGLRLVRGHAVVVAAAWTALVACGGSQVESDSPGWATLPFEVTPPELPSEHLLGPIVDALERGDCPDVVAQSTAVRDRVEREVARAFGPAPEGTVGDVGPSAADLRRVLQRYVYVEPPVLELGEHGFAYPSWWSRTVAHCLSEMGRHERAAAEYNRMLQEGFEPDLLWHLGVSYALAGRAADALDVLSAWPVGLPTPEGYDELMGRLNRGEAPTGGTQAGRLSID